MVGSLWGCSRDPLSPGRKEVRRDITISMVPLCMEISRIGPHLLRSNNSSRGTWVPSSTLDTTPTTRKCRASLKESGECPLLATLHRQLSQPQQPLHPLRRLIRMQQRRYKVQELLPASDRTTAWTTRNRSEAQALSLRPRPLKELLLPLLLQLQDLLRPRGNRSRTLLLPRNTLRHTIDRRFWRSYSQRLSPSSQS